MIKNSWILLETKALTIAGGFITNCFALLTLCLGGSYVITEVANESST